VSVVFVSTWQDAGEPCVRKAWETWVQTRDLLAACESGLVEVEMDPRFRAVGFGSLPNREGEQELDAGMMDGGTLAIGSVCSVRGVVPVISVARRVMERTPHVMLAGDQAKRFAEREGFSVRCLHSEQSLSAFEEWIANKRDAEVAHLVHDTVTIVGCDDTGHCVSACSTSGLAWKLPGRVGDSPIAGAGFYANDEFGAAGATGVGEDIWRFMLSFQVVEAMREGISALESCRLAIHRMVSRKPDTREKTSAVIAVSRHGDWGAAATKAGFTAWVCDNGVISSHRVEPTF
jgi:N4-(beta-N-acetylglucosaminyl)-L-asparaginase